MTSDIQLIRQAIDLAQSAVQAGNMPFGALVAAADGRVLVEVENTAMTSPDCTGHAETLAARQVSLTVSESERSTLTLYTSAEPCPMCCGAIFWAGIGRVVFAASVGAFIPLMAASAHGGAGFQISAREIFATAGRPVIVDGPLLEDIAIRLHQDYWAAPAADRSTTLREETP